MAISAIYCQAIAINKLGFCSRRYQVKAVRDLSRQRRRSYLIVDSRLLSRTRGIISTSGSTVVSTQTMVIPLDSQTVAASPFQHHSTLPILGLSAFSCHPFDSHCATINKVADFSVIMFAIKRALKLNNSEATLMAKHAGFRRVVYNMRLSLRTQMYGESFLQSFGGSRASPQTLRKLSDAKVIAGIKKVLTNHVKKRPEFAWMNDLSSKVYQSALQDLQTAFTRYRQRLAKHPVFASRRDGQSFAVYDGNGKVWIPAGCTLKIPTLGTFRLYEPLVEGYITQTFTVAKEGGRWYVSFCVDAERLPVSHIEGAVGIDVGVKSFATLSTGVIFDAPKPLRQAKAKLAQLQRKASRQVLGSANQRQTYDKIRRLHARVANVRKDFLHKLTTYLAKTFKIIKIEDLNISGMLANHKLAGAISDLGFYEFKRQLIYKCQMYGSELVLVDQWFPSTKTCSCCGHIQPMSLSDRVYTCPGCGMVKDRDLNASINILNWEPTACG